MLYSDYVNEQHRVFQETPHEDVSAFVEGLKSLRSSRGTLWIAGNGGSSASASHAVADFAKTMTQAGMDGIPSVAISEMVSLQTAFANDESFEAAVCRTLELMSKPGDALLIISVSGLSPNLVAAVEWANSNSLATFSLVGERGAALAAVSTNSVVVPSNDYQIVENLHMSLIHWFVKALA